MPYKLDLDFNRSVVGLDLSAERSGVFTPQLASIELNEEALQHFNRVAAGLVADFRPLSLDQFAGACRRVLRAGAVGVDSPFLRARLRRAAELRAMLADADWPMDEALRRQGQAVVAYFDDPHGLIDNAVPGIGRLDEAMLMDVAMQVLRAELDDYAAFCRERASESARGGGGLQRAQWEDQRRQEHRLEQQLQRVRGSSYGGGGAEAVFRVC